MRASEPGRARKSRLNRAPLVAELHPAGDGGGVPTVTVVIPCFNYATYLDGAVASALTQVGVDVSVVIVDDASTDDSVQVAERLASADPRVSLIRNLQNVGPVDTFNRGLTEAHGEFIVRLDADDLLTPGSLRRATAVLQSLPRVGLVYGHPLHFSSLPLPKARVTPHSWIVWSGRDWLEARCVDGTNVITSPEVVMRKSVVDVVGGQRPLAHTHDMEMWLRIAAHSDVAFVTHVDQAWHREHSKSLSNHAADSMIILPELKEAFDLLLKNPVVGHPDDPRLLGSAHRALASDALRRACSLAETGGDDQRAVRLMEFARECDPSAPATALWRHCARWLARGPERPNRSRLGRLPRRAVGRWRNWLRAGRWSRTGVYERLSLNKPVESRAEADR